MSTSAQPDPHPPEHWTIRRLRQFWLVIPLGLILLALMMEDLHVMGWSPFESDACGVAELDQSSFSAKLYNPLAEWGVRHTGSPQVALIYIDSSTEPPELLTNTCASRVFLARLIQDLNKLNPNVIVIDKFYTDAACGEADKNATFKSALSTSSAPVVVGRPTHPLADSSSLQGCMGLSSGMTFPPGANVRVGLTRLNADTLKVPTRWPVFDDSSEKPVLQPPEAGDTLSLVAAKAQWPGIEQSPPMARLLDAGTHPYTTFINLPNIHAMTAICSAEENPLYADGTPIPCDQKKWKQDSNSIDGKQLNLKGKVVIIGDITEADMQPFPTEVQPFPSGQVPGVYLQANYIESLLDQRFLTQTPMWVTVLFLMLFVIGIYCLYWAHGADGKPLLTLEKAGIGSVLLLSIMIVLDIAALLAFNYYTPVWALWGAGFFMVFRYLESSGHHRSQHLLGKLGGAHSGGQSHHLEGESKSPEAKG
ncbi:MAG TPA: CHASE2 domain-containing protein [Acidobacteriaceae bacterium]|jgi:CHASE2 domain-containing sensor protein